MKSYRTLGAALLAAFAPVSLAHAEQLAGLTTNQRIVTFDSATPGTIISNFAISGLSAGDQLVGIDLRPVNSLIYGIAQTGRVYTLSTSGMASLASTMSVAPVGGRFGFDFNPMADRLRVIAETDQNLAVNVTDGATLNQTGITRSSGAIDILGSAYTNNFPGTASTVLYGLDAVSDTLVVTAGPGGGIYTNVAPIGFGLTSTSNVGFDISGSTGMAFFNIEDALYSINLMPGTNNAANFIGTIGVGPLIGLTATTGAVPEPATWAMMITGFGIVGATARRRRRVASFV